MALNLVIWFQEISEEYGLWSKIRTYIACYKNNQVNGSAVEVQRVGFAQTTLDVFRQLEE